MATQPTKLPDPTLLTEEVTRSVAGTPSDGALAEPVAKPHMIGNYQILEEVARGGMGVVFKARHVTNGNIVALKTIRLDRDVSTEMAQRFAREVQAAQQLKHPHVVPIHDVGHDGHRAYFTMDLMAAGNLGRHRRRFQADPRAAAALLAKVARGVQHAHENGILHRDLKPGNILLDANDEPLIGDFGLARFLDTEMELTRTGQALGTPGYMAPEQALGQRKRISARTDIWSLGVILYELLTGQRPFLAEDEVELIEKIQHGQPPSPRSLQPALDSVLESIVLKCLEKDPSDRYASARDLAGDLECWFAGQPISIRKPSRIRRFRKSLRRHPWLSLAGVLTLVAAAFVPVFLYWSDPDRPLHSLERKLAAGEAVELIGDKGRPAWHRVVSGNMDPNERFKLDPDGFFSIDSYTSICLVELVPDPHLERYRFRAWVRQNDNVEVGMVGLYFNHYQVVDGVHRSNFYNMLGVAEPEKSSLYFMHHHEEPTGQGGVHQAGIENALLPKGPAGFGTWRELSVEVTPESVSTFLNGALLAKLDGALMNKRTESLRKWLPNRELPKYSPRRGIGLYVFRGGASFKSAVVEPVP